MCTNLIHPSSVEEWYVNTSKLIALLEFHKEALKPSYDQFWHNLSFAIRYWSMKTGVPFRTHLYVPEVHPVSGQEYHEKVDDAHVLKVLCARIILYVISCYALFYRE